MPLRVPMKFSPENPDTKPPKYESVGASGFDIHVDMPNDLLVTLHPGERILVHTGIYLAIPLGYELQLRPRSGLALKNGITVLNSPATIDADYRGEVKLLIINHSNATFTFVSNDRLAQGVIGPVMQADFDMVTDLPDTARGAGGFGSTGV